MLHVVTQKSDRCAEWLEKSFTDLLSAIRDEGDVFDLSAAELHGDIVLLKIKNYYDEYGLIDNDASPSDNVEEFVQIMQAKLKYITAYENEENDYSLYKLPTGRLKDYYISHGYLPMRLGGHDAAAAEKYRQLAAKIYR